VNAEGTGQLLSHCRRARAVLVMSSNVIYPPHDDPWHAHGEDEPIGGMIPFWSPTSPTAKVAEEAVARSYARTLDLPVTIARLNTVYGPQADYLPVMPVDAVVSGRPVAARGGILTLMPRSTSMTSWTRSMPCSTPRPCRPPSSTGRATSR
jgi:nucleoside-diphosphate-sugar epimerase